MKAKKHLRYQPGRGNIISLTRTYSQHPTFSVISLTANLTPALSDGPAWILMNIGSDLTRHDSLPTKHLFLAILH